jgi:hypothetical protein
MHDRATRGCRSVVRFYTGHAIGALAAGAQYDWHAYLFNGITQWWLPGTSSGSVSYYPQQTKRPQAMLSVWIKTPGSRFYRPEVSRVLKEWQQMSTSLGVSPCAQRLMVLKALNKAESVGLEHPADQMLYALCYPMAGSGCWNLKTFMPHCPRLLMVRSV